MKQIPLYKRRSFGDKLSDTLSFVGDNFKPLLKYTVILSLPVAIIMGLIMNSYMTTSLKMAMTDTTDFPSEMLNRFLLLLGIFIASSVIGVAIITCVVYAYMQLNTSDVNKETIKPVFINMLKRYCRLILLGIALVIAILAASISLYFLLTATIMAESIAVGTLIVLGYILLIIFICPLALLTPIYLFESDIKLIAAIRKAIRLGFRTWAGIFAVIIVLSLLASVITSVLSMPWYIAFLAKTFFSLEEGANGFVGTFTFDIIFFILSTLESLVNLVCYTLPLVGLAYQYGHANTSVKPTNN